jgi:hypothetical protein
MIPDSTHWIAVKDGDPRAVALYQRHYSARKGKIDRVRYGISGQGESLILLTSDCRALFGWRKQIYNDDSQSGINCFVFRNEGDILSSMLIKDAMQWAFKKWGKQRLYTYIDSTKIKHKRDPGRCFIKAGFRKCGLSQKGLLILEYQPEQEKGSI